MDRAVFTAGAESTQSGPAPLVLPPRPEVDPVAPPLPVEDPPGHDDPAPPPAFVPREDPAEDPTPVCPEGTPDADPQEFETCRLLAKALSRQ